MAPSDIPRSVLTRRGFLRAGAVGIVAGSTVGSPWGGGQASARTGSGQGPAAHTVGLNADWRFGGPLVDGSTQPGFDDSGFPRVVLPHTVTDLSWRRWDPSAWEKRWIYRRHFDVPDGLSGLRLFVDFAGALTGASVVLNGRELGEHLGGYLPFGYEITHRASRRDNLLAVALDSRFDLDVPPDRPGQPTTSVDFWQPGGIYRQVSLRAVPQVFLADVFAKPVDVLDPSRRVQVECTVDAAQRPGRSARVVVELLRDGRKVARESAPVTIEQSGSRTVTVTLERLGDIALWEIEHPHLYDVVATLVVDGRPVHDHGTRIGFRDARFTTDGFYLNGERRQLFGVNRHQFYPFAGAAMPVRVQRKDAEILRHELNCNIVRCSHYPQAEAFLDACDELGLLAFEEVPGWGLYLGDEPWRERVVRDVRDMVVRDRNHPSIVVWGARLNETDDDVELFTRTRDLAHDLDDSRQTTGAMVGGLYDSQQFVQDVFSYNDYHRQDGHASLLAPRSDLPYLVTEAVGTLSGPAKYFRRTDPVADQQGQALAHAWVHEIAASDDGYCGLVAWSGYDYPSGTGNNYQGVKYTGVVDLFREPKLGAAIYQAQVDPAVRPVIVPAFYWDFGPTSPANGPGVDSMICSNCDRLELFVGDERFAEVEPDRGRFGHLRFPPSFVDLTVDGSDRPELRIDGYVGGEPVTSRTFSSDSSGDVLAVRADDDQLVADGADATRVVFRVLDRYGAPRPYPHGDVEISIDGAGTLVGETPFAFGDAGGVGACWVRTVHNRHGRVEVRVTHPTLDTGSASIHVRPAPHGGRPAANADLALEAVPALVRARETTRVTATLTNHEPPPLRDARLSLPVPLGWSKRPVGPTTFDLVRPGQSISTTWEVMPPRDVPPGRTALTATAAYRAVGREDASRAHVTVVVPTTLEQARDNVGTSDDADVDAGDLDGVGNSYSRDALADAGLSPGAEVTHDGVTFVWPDVRASAPDNLLCNGQTVVVEGTGRVVGFLGSTSRGPITGAVTVHYSDGSTSESQLTLDDYFNPPRSGNEVVAEMPYLNSQGIGGRPRGRRDHTVFVFYTAVPVVQGREVAGVTVPRVGGTVAGGRPAMHLFDVAVG